LDRKLRDERVSFKTRHQDHVQQRLPINSYVQRGRDRIEEMVSFKTRHQDLVQQRLPINSYAQRGQDRIGEKTRSERAQRQNKQLDRMQGRLRIDFRKQRDLQVAVLEQEVAVLDHDGRAQGPSEGLNKVHHPGSSEDNDLVALDLKLWMLRRRREEACLRTLLP